MRISKTLGLIGAAALIMTAAGSAMAEGNGDQLGNPDQWVQKGTYNGTTSEPSADSKIIWTAKKGDSPIDSNTRALHAVIAPGDFAEFYTQKSLEIDKRVGDVNNMSYDFRASDAGAGAPRISVVLSDGSVAYLTSSTCKKPIAVSGGTWSRADFTGASDNCSFYDNANVKYEADGTHSAWDAFTEAHPNLRVSYSFLVFDEPGDYLVDRVSLGSNRMYNTANKRAVNCQGDEDVC